MTGLSTALRATRRAGGAAVGREGDFGAVARQSLIQRAPGELLAGWQEAGDEQARRLRAQTVMTGPDPALTTIEEGRRLGWERASRPAITARLASGAGWRRARLSSSQACRRRWAMD